MSEKTMRHESGLILPEGPCRGQLQSLAILLLLRPAQQKKNIAREDVRILSNDVHGSRRLLALDVLFTQVSGLRRRRVSQVSPAAPAN